MADNPQRPTATWKLWMTGIAGGLIVAGMVFVTGIDDRTGTMRDVDQARRIRMTRSSGRW